MSTTVNKATALLAYHSSTATVQTRDGQLGIRCGCLQFIPQLEGPKDGADMAYNVHLAEALGEAKLLKEDT